MTFGILSRYHQNNGLFDTILTRLLIHERTSSLSTLVVPFVIIDSINDMHFSFKETEYEMIRKLVEMLLVDYKNLSGFSRLEEHRKLIHFYFFKLKDKYENILLKWFIDKINDDENIAPCANIIYQLKWYSPKFHEIFLKNLHHDSQVWNWPVDSLLRYYSTEIKHQPVLLTRLQFKKEVIEYPELIQYVMQHPDWLCLITALYGGYKNYNTPTTIAEYSTTAQFLQLTGNERMPFIYYYQNIWGRDDPAYSMALHLDAFQSKQDWNIMPTFDSQEIYKESFLTGTILELLHGKRSTTELIEEVRKQILYAKLSIAEKIEALTALVALGDFEFLHMFVENQDEALKSSLGNVLKQTISVLKDSIARWSSYANECLLRIYNDTNGNQSKHNFHFADYCKIYLSLIASSNGLPVNTTKLAETVENFEHVLYQKS
ncbi:hypothetical protein I4U23_023365 [Adineta vaga]|nr:hypothetical protein I4U23_023365 [Adineta vaga]